MRLHSLHSSSAERGSLLLAPSYVTPGAFANVLADTAGYRTRLAEAQRLRGKIAVQENAIPASELLPDGRHVQPADRDSWHLLTLDASGRVAACMRYHAHPSGATFEDLSISHSTLAQSEDWGPQLRGAVEADLRNARRRGWSYVELGGWVISEAMRCTTEALRMIASAYAFAQLCGGAMGVTTASTRRCSAAILKRIGGQRLRSRGVELPSFYDQHYRCHMEVLRFDSSRPNPRYRHWMDACRSRLQSIRVICQETADAGAAEALEFNPEAIEDVA
jgi:hypothetical protein